MAYNGGRGANVNVSEYINQLNAIPTAQDTESLPFDDDLAMFTNTEWFDYDLQQNLEGGHTEGKTEALPAESFDFGQGDFSFPDFNFENTHPSPYTNTNVLPTPIQTQPHYYPGTSTVASPTALEPPTPTTATNTAQKRKASSPLDSESLEEDSRAVAEEDKRRRNTAASARFRVKKKQREQALEKSAKEMSDKVAALEGRINQLETENKWLKNLVTEKTETKEDIATLWKKYSAEKESSPEERTKGVGTA